MAQNVTLQDLTTGTPIYPATTVEQVDGLETKLTNIEGKFVGLETSTSVDSKLANLKSEILGDDLTETFDTLKAVQDWADEHGTEYGKLVDEVGKKATKDEVNTISSSLNDVKGDLETIQSDIDDKLDASVYQSYIATLEETIESLKSRLTTLENKEVSNVKYVAV